MFIEARLGADAGPILYKSDEGNGVVVARAVSRDRGPRSGTKNGAIGGGVGRELPNGLR